MNKIMKFLFVAMLAILPVVASAVTVMTAANQGVAAYRPKYIGLSTSSVGIIALVNSNTVASITVRRLACSVSGASTATTVTFVSYVTDPFFVVQGTQLSASPFGPATAAFGKAYQGFVVSQGAYGFGMTGFVSSASALQFDLLPVGSLDLVIPAQRVLYVFATSELTTSANIVCSVAWAE
jgi:hypothetical protein